jgi:DNA-binding transcriptional regulator YiaG
MEKKIQEQFIDYGCGFPIVLRNVPMVKIDDKWAPNINYNKLEKAVSIMLCHKQAKLTGNEIRFIRLYLGMTLDIFAKRFGVKHPTVIKWENFREKHTNMSLGTEKDIRLCLISYITGKKQISSLYNELVTLPLSPTEEQEKVELDLDLNKIAV